jgi:hypothetical protein
MLHVARFSPDASMLDGLNILASNFTLQIAEARELAK